MKKIPVLAVVGPTASGKTALGVALALRLGGEIVSCDSMQIYEGLEIATAKPTMAERRGVPHHLIGFVPMGVSYNVARFVQDAGAAVADIHARGRLPILVGGTGLYVSSLLDGITFSAEKRDETLRTRLAVAAVQEGNEAMHRRLEAVDPDYAAKLHPNNLGRVLRALELYEGTGVTMSRQLMLSRQKSSPYAPIMLGLDCSCRENLYERIDQRVDAMLRAGLEQESADFYQKHLDAGTAAQAIGCKELLPFLRGDESLEICVERLKRETRRYAKRQRTWFRRDGRVCWLWVDQYADADTLCEAALRLIEAQKGVER